MGKLPGLDAGIDHHERCARLERGEQRHHGLDPALEIDRHSVAAPNTERRKTMPKTVGATVELGEGEPALADRQRDLVRSCLRRVLEPSVDQHGARYGPRLRATKRTIRSSESRFSGTSS